VIEEAIRLEQAESPDWPWHRWGPYLSERQWGTVREDYSSSGAAWEYFGHDHSRSRAYRWGEDGIAGLSDDQQRLCLAVALWNGHDAILKERLFGLTNSEANHGEDVKELYYYLDATPTHSYLKMLYKYPQRTFPYAQLIEENRVRTRQDPECELMDTGIFDDHRYFDVFVEYAKAAPEDILLQITVCNRGPEAAAIHVLPQLWFRNTWSWGYNNDRPTLTATSEHSVLAQHPSLGDYTFAAPAARSLLFCDNETNGRRLWGALETASYPKDAFHEYIVDGNVSAVNPERTGTKVAAHHVLVVPAGCEEHIRVRLRRNLGNVCVGDVDAVLSMRRREADEFYADLQRDLPCEDKRRVQRQAFAGLVWNKQFFCYDIPQWLNGDPASPVPPAERKYGRNHEWAHVNAADVMSMPDKWEYPWFAAWDLAFHAIPFALIDPEFAKQQLVLITRERYMHPNGQLPAYEWAFGDVNPPVHAWAAWRVFQIDRKQKRRTHPNSPGDLEFLERVFHKLILNFYWWINRKDAAGRNIFQGGFLGLDNIGVFDRSSPLPTGGCINQSDGTSWMAMYSLNLMRIALELAQHNRVYEDIATTFLEHFLDIAKAMTNIGGQGIGLWDDEDGFFYDVLDLPDGRMIPLKLRSMVGLIPLFAVETLEPDLLRRVPAFSARLEWYLEWRPDLAALVSRWHEPGNGERRLLSLLRGSRMKKLLRRMLDESEFLSDYGVRALSRCHREQPYTFRWDDQERTVGYQPAESTSGLYGGNSNWRGPIWLPVNFLIVESLQKFHHYYGDEFKIECPTGSGTYMSINDVAVELTRRLMRLFVIDSRGRRVADDEDHRLQQDAHFRDYLLFHEYFDGDTGRGLGASHQTGWTGLVAKLLQSRGEADARQCSCGSCGSRRNQIP
jgi:Mannosylglycerate hydrolase MGH1-like glycoside hydrolase domain